MYMYLTTVMRERIGRERERGREKMESERGKERERGVRKEGAQETTTQCGWRY